MREIAGTLVKIKESDKNLIYEIETDIMGLKGSIYVDRSRLPYFDKLILTKGETVDQDVTGVT